MLQLFKMAYRNLMRNRRRSLLSALAVAMGLALLLLIAGMINGEIQASLKSTLRLITGHVQVRSASYVEEKSSLKWEDLVADPDAVAAKIRTVPHVIEATPRLYASAILTNNTESNGVQLIGIDPLSKANAPFTEGMVSGNFLTPDDREGIVIGQTLADKIKVKAGDQVDLLANTSNGDVNSQNFTIRGIYSTHVPSYDEGTIFMPIAKAQALTQTQNHASVIFILLDDREQADAVAAAIASPGYQVQTWLQMNAFLVEWEQIANSYMIIIYLIVLAVTATVVVNTLVMAVFERTREIGIMAAIGMKGRRIMALFLAEATLLAAGGIVFGLILGWLVATYFAKYGFYIGNFGTSGILLQDRLYASLTVKDSINLTIIAIIVTLLASLYPALLAARLEPVDALHGK